MKKLLKILSFGLLLLLGFVIGYVAMIYHNDIPVSELKEKYVYPESKFMEIQGMDIHYRITGGGFPFVLVHGTAASLHTWEDWTRILDKDFQIISFDLPAFGLTGPRPDREYSIKNYVSVLNDFVEKIGLDSFHLAGNSLGGSIAWNYAVTHPQKVAKLVLIDASGYKLDKEPPMVFKLAQNPMTRKLLEKLTPKSLVDKSLREVYHNDVLISKELEDRYFEMTLREGNRQAFADRVSNVKYENPELIKTIQNPTLILWGQTDAWIPVECANYFHRDIKDSELIIYDNAGHVPMEEIPEQSAEDTRTFLLKGEELNAQLLPNEGLNE